LFTPAPSVDNAGGVLGWVRLTLDDVLELDGLVVRRNGVGELTVSFPSRVDGAGYRRYFARPVNEAARVAIVCQVLEHLRSTRRIPS
jgi:DNA-binding cell septation regulator SpoVG